MAKTDVSLNVRHGSMLTLRGVTWLVCDRRGIDYAILGRNVLDALGLDNRTMLSAAKDRLGSDIDVVSLEKSSSKKSGHTDETTDERTSSVCHLHRGTDSMYHTDRFPDEDHLDDTNVYIDMGEDPETDLRDELKKRVGEAKTAGFSYDVVIN